MISNLFDIFRKQTGLRLMFHLVKSLVKSEILGKRSNPEQKCQPGGYARVCSMFLFLLCYWPSSMAISSSPCIHSWTSRVSPYMGASSCLTRVPRSFTGCVYFFITAGDFFSDFIVWAPLSMRSSCLPPLEYGFSLIRFTAARLTCH